jgi:hypothetical protein
MQCTSTMWIWSSYGVWCRGHIRPAVHALQCTGAPRAVRGGEVAYFMLNLRVPPDTRAHGSKSSAIGGRGAAAGGCGGGAAEHAAGAGQRSSSTSQRSPGSQQPRRCRRHGHLQTGRHGRNDRGPDVGFTPSRVSVRFRHIYHFVCEQHIIIDAKSILQRPGVSEVTCSG